MSCLSVVTSFLRRTSPTFLNSDLEYYLHVNGTLPKLILLSILKVHVLCEILLKPPKRTTLFHTSMDLLTTKRYTINASTLSIKTLLTVHRFSDQK